MPSWVRASLNALSCSVSTGHDALAQMDLVIDAPLEIAVGANRWRGGLVVSWHAQPPTVLSQSVATFSPDDVVVAPCAR